MIIAQIKTIPEYKFLVLFFLRPPFPLSWWMKSSASRFPISPKHKTTWVRFSIEKCCQLPFRGRKTRQIKAGRTRRESDLWLRRDSEEERALSTPPKRWDDGGAFSNQKVRNARGLRRGGRRWEFLWYRVRTRLSQPQLLRRATVSSHDDTDMMSPFKAILNIKTFLPCASEAWNGILYSALLLFKE